MATAEPHPSQKSFTHAAEQAQQWVNELAKELDWSEQNASHLLKAVLHAVRDWLSLEEMADLSSQLPMLVRGMFFEGWRPDGPTGKRKKRDFIIHVRRGFGHEPDFDYDRSIAAVFQLLDRHLSHGEIVQVRNSMKKSLRRLWPDG